MAVKQLESLVLCVVPAACDAGKGLVRQDIQPSRATPTMLLSFARHASPSGGQPVSRPDLDYRCAERGMAPGAARAGRLERSAAVVAPRLPATLPAQAILSGWPQAAGRSGFNPGFLSNGPATPVNRLAVCRPTRELGWRKLRRGNGERGLA